MAALTVGSPAPDFDLPIGTGGTLSLRSLRGKKVVLYFYPKDNTSGCTREACAFQSDGKKLAKKNAVVVGVSADPPASHAKFAEKYGLTFPLVSDTEKVIIKKYGVWQEKNMYGKKSMGVVRTTFVIDVDGTIAHIFPKVSVDGHIEEVLAVL